MSATELKLNQVLDYIQKTEGLLPSIVTAVFHIKDCPKKELKELAEKLNICLVTPEDNLYADCYTMALDINSARILVHSVQIKFECKEVEDAE